MKIALDVMGSDKGPREVIKGGLDAARSGIEIIYVGNAEIIREAARAAGAVIDDGHIINASSVITMNDDPMKIRSDNDSSMRRALSCLADGEADALVSCGNTGALITGGTLYIHRIKGVHRAALGAILPLETPVLLLDAGANISVNGDMLLQFGIMGSVYMSRLFGLSAPRVGLLNIGAEESKGTPLCIEAFGKLSASPHINFTGNIEGKDIPFSKCDVIVSDGFSGNLVLKSIEGMGKYAGGSVKKLFSSFNGRLAAIPVIGRLKRFAKSMDPSAHGGAPLLGLSKPVIKAHGGSDAAAVSSAVRRAATFAETGVTEAITKICRTAGE